MSTKLTPEIITAAIEGFEAERRRIDEQITEMRAMLNGAQPKAAAAPEKGTRRTMSAAGRKRIAEAQAESRWAGSDCRRVEEAVGGEAGCRRDATVSRSQQSASQEDGSQESRIVLPANGSSGVPTANDRQLTIMPTYSTAI